ncbi:cytochrome c oxidase subunit II [Asticcacaulis sp. EMRT-3]|uniref:cytochrome c oxidase subunit II n=1 Tax=Asticcacaulis sp. EMRT-3 TaxID=3040349 RepID=UPI0024AFFC0E|nr:cytochrome c oxidase subunit II [Asticcacaulis sp. EMRT-3]MDI7774718.1 cytochrome c oxidase subunit II [Asticcacaulis sp. EMRT-3]
MGIKGLFKAATGAASVFALAGMMSVQAFAEDLKMGQPTDGAMGWQPAATGLKLETENFYNHLLFPIITGICVLVLALLVWIVIRYNSKANPVPARFSHNTLIEVIWTAVPVLILVVIAVYSLSLLRDYDNMPSPDVVVKATGSQWFWTYDYPELGVSDVESRLLDDAKDLKTAHAKNIPYLLEVDNPLVVPVNKVVHVEVTGSDVIHSFTVPAFGFKMDAVPGRLNNTWFKATKIGTYYGECSELCGKDHGFMPIEVKVVSQADFDSYIVSQGGKTAAMQAADAAASAAASQAAAVSEAASASAAATSEAASSAAASAH